MRYLFLVAIRIFLTGLFIHKSSILNLLTAFGQFHLTLQSTSAFQPLAKEVNFGAAVARCVRIAHQTSPFAAPSLSRRTAGGTA